MNWKKHNNSILNRNSSRFEAIILDMDGVIVNSEPFYVEVEQANFKQLGLDISVEEHQTYQGTATDLMWTLIKERHGIEQPLEKLVEMSNSLVTPFFHSLETIEPMPGVREYIVKVKEQGIPLALASSSYAEVIEIILQKTGLKSYFDAVVDSKMAGASKPRPDIFLLAAQKLGVAPEKCIVIEDSTNGIRAAKLAGMYCIAFAGPGSELQDQSEADEIIKEFSELL
jgi:beta-phosphoglucomutase